MTRFLTHTFWLIVFTVFIALNTSRADSNTMKRLVFVRVPMESLRNLSELTGVDEVDTCTLYLKGKFVNEGPRGYYCEASKFTVNKFVKLHGINWLYY